MLAIEAKRVLKDGLVIFLVLAVIVAGILGTDHDSQLVPALEIFLLLYAAFMGWSLFERERQENAGEYMLSLPLPRWRLLLLKILPRLLIVSLILLVYLGLYQRLKLPAILSAADFAILYFAFFFLAVSFSISLRNFISAFFFVCLLSVGQVLLLQLLDPSRELGSAIRQSSLTSLAFPLLFCILFQGYDIRPSARFNRRLYPGLLLISGLIAGFLLLTAPPNWKNLYLTRGGVLIKNSCQLSEIDLGKQRRRLDFCLIALRETADGRTLYAATRKRTNKDGCVEMSLVSLDLKSGDVKTLYTIAPGWSIAPGYAGEIGAVHAGTYSLFLQHVQAQRAMIVRVRDSGAEEIPIAGPFADANISYVFYLEGSPPQLVLFSQTRLYRLDIDGKTRELAQSKSIDAWGDRILLFEPSGMSLYRIGPELTLLRRWQGSYVKSLRRISGYESRSVIVREGRSYFWMDLERQQEQRLDAKSPPYTYQQRGESLLVVFANDAIFTIREIRDGRERETDWVPGFQPSGIRISPFGLLVFREKEFKVYPFGN
ncbi:MAG: ABC transporter permease subunit [Acidobacteria bacterium]|jgi:hypothetical protein|nr:ABC transporter permease subunit [Acidobacteriota bacterium]